MKALRFGGALLLATAGTAGLAVGQDPPSSQQAEQGREQDSLRREIQQLREELIALRNKSNIDQLRIRDLEDRLSNLEQAQAEEPFFADPVAGPLQDPVAGPLQGPVITGGNQGNLLNPKITVFLDTVGSISDDSNNKALNRFSLREVEVDFRAAISPIADGVFTGSFHEEIEQMMDGSVDIDTNAARGVLGRVGALADCGA